MIHGSVHGLGRDLKYGIRGLLRNPLFSIVALLTLAIGIGANTAVFSVVDGVLLKPLPYPKSDDLVAIRHTAPGAPGIVDVSGGLRPSPSMALTYADENRTFEHVGLYTTASATVTGEAEPEQVGVVAVTDGVLQALGVPPLHGRWLSASDMRPNGPANVMLTYGYWQQRFGGDPAAVGRTIEVNSESAQIIGVMPRGFRVVDTEAELIVPAQIDRSTLTLPPFCCRAVARLKPGVTLDEANADIARMLPIWTQSWPFEGDASSYLTNWRITPDVRPLKQDVVGSVDGVLWIVMGTIGIVLLIACANVANLLLVRTDGRRQELAIRAALGAGSGHIGRQLIAECLLLGLLGGVIGVGFAYAGIKLLTALGPESLPRLDEVSLDPAVLGFACAVSVFAGVIVGLIPAIRFAGPRLSTSLKSSTRVASGGPDRHRTQSALVVAQVALALVLLVSSGLMIRSFQALRSVDPGFTNAEQIQTMRISIPFSTVPEPERVVRMQRDILDALAAIPGVSSAAFASSAPMETRNTDWDGVRIEGMADDEIANPNALRRFKYQSPGFFEAVGTRIVAGRDFSWADIDAERPVAVVSENFAREIWNDPTAALGKRIGVGRGSDFREIVGVVQDVPDNGLEEPAPSIVYWPSMMRGFYSFEDVTLTRNATFVVRSPLAGTQGLVRQIQQAVWSVNPSLPVALVATMQDYYDASLATTSFTLVMLATAASVSLVLGVVGLYGVLAYAVSQRRREIAIRLALGAQARTVIRGFVLCGLALTGAGVAIGLVIAAGVTQLMASILYEIEPLDGLTYAAVALVLAAAAALASYLPARQASGVDPASALAAE